MAEIFSKECLKVKHVMRHNQGIWNAIRSDMFIVSTFVRYGHQAGLLAGLNLKPSAVILFNIYNKDQPSPYTPTLVKGVHANPFFRLYYRSFIYADALCIASQGNDFNDIEASLTSALNTMTTYYDSNQLRANPSKTQVCAFHLRNR